MRNLVLALFLGLFLVACNNETANSSSDNNDTEQDSTELTKEDQKDEMEVNIADESVKTFSGTFVEFSLGDRPYYDFKGEDGEITSFMRCEDKNYKFERELSDEEVNDENQGFGSNEDLVGKQFKLTYEIRQEAEYIDGPIGDVKIITKVEEL
jgi:hypothetical protein